MVETASGSRSVQALPALIAALRHAVSSSASSPLPDPQELGRLLKPLADLTPKAAGSSMQVESAFQKWIEATAEAAPMAQAAGAADQSGPPDSDLQLVLRFSEIRMRSAHPFSVPGLARAIARLPLSKQDVNTLRTRILGRLARLPDDRVAGEALLGLCRGLDPADLPTDVDGTLDRFLAMGLPVPGPWNRVAATVLKRFLTDRDATALAIALPSRPFPVRRRVAFALGACWDAAIASSMPPAAALDLARLLLADGSPEVWPWAARALAMAPADDPAGRFLADLLDGNGESLALRRRAVAGLGRMAGRDPGRTLDIARRVATAQGPWKDGSARIHLANAAADLLAASGAEAMALVGTLLDGARRDPAIALVVLESLERAAPGAVDPAREAELIERLETLAGDAPRAGDPRNALRLSDVLARLDWHRQRDPRQEPSIRLTAREMRRPRAPGPGTPAALARSFQERADRWTADVAAALDRTKAPAAPSPADLDTLAPTAIRVWIEATQAILIDPVLDERPPAAPRDEAPRIDDDDRWARLRTRCAAIWGRPGDDDASTGRLPLVLQMRRTLADREDTVDRRVAVMDDALRHAAAARGDVAREVAMGALFVADSLPASPPCRSAWRSRFLQAAPSPAVLRVIENQHPGWTTAAEDDVQAASGTSPAAPVPTDEFGVLALAGAFDAPGRQALLSPWLDRADRTSYCHERLPCCPGRTPAGPCAAAEPAPAHRPDAPWHLLATRLQDLAVGLAGTGFDEFTPRRDGWEALAAGLRQLSDALGPALPPSTRSGIDDALDHAARIASACAREARALDGRQARREHGWATKALAAEPPQPDGSGFAPPNGLTPEVLARMADFRARMHRERLAWLRRLAAGPAAEAPTLAVRTFRLLDQTGGRAFWDVSSPTGVASELEAVPDWERLLEAARELDAGLDSLGTRRASPGDAALRARTACPGHLQRALDAADDAAWLFDLSPAGWELPWELLPVGPRQEPGCLHRAIGRRLRIPGATEPPAPPPGNGVAILIGEGVTAATDEVATIRDAWQARLGEAPRVLETAGHPGELARFLDPVPDVLHVIGHMAERGRGGPVRLRGGLRLDAPTLAAALPDAVPRLVFLNACRSLRDIAAPDQPALWLARRGTAVVGTLHRPWDRTAGLLAAAFHRWLAQDMTVGNALLAARRTATTPDDPVSPMGYTLLGDPVARLASPPR